MSVSDYDQYRPPEPSRRSRRRRGGASRRAGSPTGGPRRAQRGADGSREVSMVEEPEFSSYYGRPVVKAPPWGDEISAYLFLGGLAGGSALLGFGAQLTDRPVLRRNARLTTIGALGLGTVALVHDLGRPERFLYMLRTFKPTSPMSVGTWILSGFGLGAGVAAAAEMDRLTGERLPLGPMRPALVRAEGVAGTQMAIMAGPLASYTAVLLSNTSVPSWHAARDQLPYVFVSSACMASCGMAMITTAPRETGPARVLGAAAAVVEAFTMKRMLSAMHPAEAEPYEDGAAGTKLKWAERLGVLGGVAAAVAGRSRIVAGLGGAAMVTASALTRFGVMEAGLASTKDPKHVIEPQKARLAARREAGITGDSITTTG